MYGVNVKDPEKIKSLDLENFEVKSFGARCFKPRGSVQEYTTIFV